MSLWARVKRLNALGRLRGLLRALSQDLGDVRFVQIGSHDGQLGDPLREFIRYRGWKGVLVEPLPQIFQRLTATYADVPGLRFEQAAISDRSGTLTFHFVEEAPEDERASLPPWYLQIGSFDRAHVMKHADRIPRLAERVREAPVPAITFDELCARNGVQRVDVLHVDTEGHDVVILRTVDLDHWQPKLVMFEHEHAAPGDLRAYLETVRRSGYDVLMWRRDTFCLRQGGWRPWRTRLAWQAFRLRSFLTRA